jgi:hypothetical protein
MFPNNYPPSYLKAQEEVSRLMMSNGFEKASDVNFLTEASGTDWGDAVFYVNWKQKILGAYRYGSPLKVLSGCEPRTEFVDKVSGMDANYGADGSWIISHTHKELLMAVTSYLLNKNHKKGDRYE